MKQDDDVRVCDECGASVYKQHLQSGLARFAGNKLLCSHCVAEADECGGSGAGGESSVFGEDLAPIEFDDEEESGASVDMTSTRIQASAEAAGSTWDDSKFNRQLKPDAKSASRCRTFHCRISDGAVEFMNHQINQWLDENKDITVKFSNTVIGMFEGKHTEPNLILTLFY